MPERSPLRGVYRRPFHRDPLFYVALVVGAALLVRGVLTESSPWWQLFEAATAFPIGFTLVALVGGFFRDPPPSSADPRGRRGT